MFLIVKFKNKGLNQNIGDYNGKNKKIKKSSKKENHSKSHKQEKECM